MRCLHSFYDHLIGHYYTQITRVSATTTAASTPRHDTPARGGFSGAVRCASCVQIYAVGVRQTDSYAARKPDQFRGFYCAAAAARKHLTAHNDERMCVGRVCLATIGYVLQPSASMIYGFRFVVLFGPLARCSQLPGRLDQIVIMCFTFGILNSNWRVISSATTTAATATARER